MNIKNLLCTVIVPLTLIACGGGGGGGGPSGPVASTNTFNVQTAYTNFARAGFSKTFTVSGSCAGSTSITAAPATTSTTFEGKFAFSGVSVSSTTLTNCTPASSSDTTVSYYDSNLIPMGRSSASKYVVFSGVPVLPTSAKVGDAVVVGTILTYTSSSRATRTGREDVSAVMEPDTATTAILNIVVKTYDASNVLTSTEQDRYRLAADGSLSFVSFDVQYATGSKIRLIGS